MSYKVKTPIDIYIDDIFHFYYYEYSFVDVSLWSSFPEFILLITVAFLIVFWDASSLVKYRLTCLSLFFIYIYYLFIFFIVDSTSELLDCVLDGLLVVDFYLFFFKFLTVALTFVVLILCKSVVHDFSSSIVSEFLIVILIAVFFMLMLLSANDLFFCYLALEGMSFSLYILASSVYRNRLSIEAAVKYFILGSVSSSILAYGISLFLIIVNTLDFFWIKLYFVHISGANGVTSASIGFVVSCILVSFLFKLSAFPCHMWAADIYEGVWTPVTSFFAIVVKMVVFVFTLRLFCYVFSTVDVWQPIFLFSGLGSIAIGSLGAVIQRRVKRFLAFTSVNQVGFLLLGLSTNTVLGVTSSILFLFVYLVMNIVFFGLILNIKHFTQRFQVVYLTDMYAAQSDRFSISGLWVLTLFSMAGIPPLAGFFTKYFILLNLIDSSIYVASIFVLVFSTLSSFYYVSFIKYILFDKKKLVNTFYLDLKTTPETGIILSISSLFILGFIFIPNKVYKLAALLGFTCKYILQ